MKDSSAREQLFTLRERVDKLEDIRLATIQYCPKCKHETVQKPRGDSGYNTCSFSSTFVTTLSNDIDDSKYFNCTNCGNTIKCSTRHTCEIVKPRGELDES